MINFENADIKIIEDHLYWLRTYQPKNWVKKTFYPILILVDSHSKKEDLVKLTRLRIYYGGAGSGKSEQQYQSMLKEITKERGVIVYPRMTSSDKMTRMVERLAMYDLEKDPSSKYISNKNDQPISKKRYKNKPFWGK